MDQAIEDVCRYFAQFSYPPTESEMYTFLSKKSSPTKFRNAIKILCESNRLTKQAYGKDVRYQIIENESVFCTFARKHTRGKTMFQTAQSILKHLRFIPSVRYVGISGSLSMLHVGKRSDMDVFVITAHGAIWQTRFILLIYKHVLAMFAPHIGKKLCFNLFFAENGLRLRKEKQNTYIGHEILQLKTIFEQDQTYEKMIRQNQWIRDFFPNVQIKSSNLKARFSPSKQSRKHSVIEKNARLIQIWWLKRKRIYFNDFGAQVWFIQEDFEKKLTFTIH